MVKYATRRGGARAKAIRANYNRSGFKYPKRTGAYYPKLRGHGGFLGDAWSWIKRKVPKGTFAKGGRALGGMLGNKFGAGGAGAAIGEGLGGVLAKITGMGAYNVKHNTLLNEGQGPPVVANSRGNVRIRHREFIQDISTSTNFQIQVSEGINPGNSALFPWLSGVANSFQQWQGHGIIFEFKTTSADALNSVNTALGTIILSTDYNVYAGAPINKQQMENLEYTVSTKPSCSTLHPIECDPRQTTVPFLYTRNGAVPSNQDARLYDLGLFNTASVGSQSNPVVGELWVSYDIELAKPQLDQGLGLEVYTAQYQCYPQTVSNPAYLGTGAQTQVFDNIGMTFSKDGSTLYFPPNTQGDYIVTWTSAWVTGQTGCAPGFTLSTGLSFNSIWGSDSNATIESPIQGLPLLTNRAVSLASVAVTYSDTISALVFTGAVGLPGLGTPASTDLLVTQINFVA